jgi:hypothetical protein
MLTTSLFEAQRLRYCATAREIGATVFLSSFDNVAPASNARRLDISIHKLQFSNTPVMNPDLEEMMRTPLPPEEDSVSAIITQYLVENSQTFKELTNLRLKVCKRKR